MQERERLLWSILIILLIIIAGYEAYCAYRMGQQVKEYQADLDRAVLGSEDPQLRTTIEQLEEELQDRLTYEFDVSHDPLDLTQVIHGRKFLASLGFSESYESQTKLRLSCTVIAEKPAAVIKFQGRSRILRLGDEINGYRLTEIHPERAVLVRGGERLTLTTEKAPETIQAEKSRRETAITVSTPDTTEIPMNF